MNKDQKIFVAGQSGFVGQSLVRALKNKFYENLVLPNREELDLLDSLAVAQFFKKNRIDFVFLCAGQVGGVKENLKFPADFIQNNLSIYSNVIQEAHRNNVKKLLFMGSSCMYSPQSSLPFKEDNLFLGPLETTNHSFAVAKLAGYELCRTINNQYSKPFITVIPTGLYGVGDHFNPSSAHVIPSLMYKFWQAIKNKENKVSIWGSGAQKREFLYIDDCTEALIEIMNNYNDPEAINIGLGTVVSVREVAQLIKDISQFKGDLIFDESQPEGMLEKRVSSLKLEELNWKPKTSFSEGLQLTWDWAIKNKFKS